MIEPIRLKPDDSAPADPQAIGIELMALLAAQVADAEGLRDLLARWGTDPTGTCRRAQPRAIDLVEQADRIRHLGESLMQASRTARVFSVAYGDEPSGGR